MQDRDIEPVYIYYCESGKKTEKSATPLAGKRSDTEGPGSITLPLESPPKALER